MIEVIKMWQLLSILDIILIIAFMINQALEFRGKWMKMYANCKLTLNWLTKPNEILVI